MSRNGFTLVEAVVAVLLLTIAVAGTYSVVLSTLRGNTGFVPYEAANDSVARLSDILRNYVTADHSAATAPLAPSGSWALPGDGSACGYWALAPLCEHDGSAYLDPRLKALYPKAKLTYTVADASGDAPSAVTFRVAWE